MNKVTRRWVLGGIGGVAGGALILGGTGYLLIPSTAKDIHSHILEQTGLDVAEHPAIRQFSTDFLVKYNREQLARDWARKRFIPNLVSEFVQSTNLVRYYEHKDTKLVYYGLRDAYLRPCINTLGASFA